MFLFPEEIKESKSQERTSPWTLALTLTSWQATVFSCMLITELIRWARRSCSWMFTYASPVSWAQAKSARTTTETTMTKVRNLVRALVPWSLASTVPFYLSHVALRCQMKNAHIQRHYPAPTFLRSHSFPGDLFYKWPGRRSVLGLYPHFHIWDVAHHF